MSTNLETLMIKARSASKRGDFDDARRCYETVLDRFPRNARARMGLDEMIRARSATVMKSNAPPQDVIDELSTLFQTGQLAQLVQQADDLHSRYPGSAFVQNLLGSAYLGLGQPSEAEAVLKDALANGGTSHPAVFSNLGMALAQLGRSTEAIAAYRQAIGLNPRHAIAHNNLGNILKQTGQLHEAVAAYRCAIEVRPDYADALNNLGLAQFDLGEHDAAEASFAATLALQPDHAAAWNNLGILLAERNDLSGAIECYEKAIAIDPRFSDACFNLGNVHKRQERLGDALEAYRKASELRPDHADTWAEQGKTLLLEGKLDEAIAAFTRALAIDPDNANARMHKLYVQAHVCDWSDRDEFDGSDARADAAIAPFGTIPFEDDPAHQLRRSRVWADISSRSAGGPARAHSPSPDGKIRVGYFSADFHDHATLFLMAGLLREHDRSRFEIHAFSYGPDLGGVMRQHLLNHVDSFTDIRNMPDSAVVEEANARGLDLAIDLKGYTQNGRLQPFAQHLAPVQLAYLGYPGSTGADFIDYLIADQQVIPAAERQFYSEKLVMMPGSYQANDNRRAIAETTASRMEFGLPEAGFVFCCFNQNYKIGPREFDIWMRLLGHVEGSVLWLIESNDWAQGNLVAEAAARGISTDRLVFAKKLPHPEHLARHRHADLFLDTFNCNAHTTASDALWSGLPVVTMAGRQFAARVGASLLHAIGLPELVTQNEADYEALCLDLASSPTRLAALRMQLAANRLTTPLFDTESHTRAIEKAYRAVWERHCAGLAPDDIEIA